MPEASTVSLRVSAPSVGEVRFDAPPMEMPARFGKLGNEASTSAPTTKRFAST